MRRAYRDATRRDAFFATAMRTDRAIAHRPRAADQTAGLLPDWLLLASWFFGGLFSSFPTAIYPRDETRSSFLSVDQWTDAFLSL